MTDILPKLLSFPSPAASSSHDAFNTHARDFLVSMNELLPAIIDGAAAQTNSLLEHIDPATHSLSYLLVLYFHIKALEKRHQEYLSNDLRPGNALWIQTVSFLTVFDPNQVKHAGSEWHRVLQVIAKSAESENKPFLAVRPIRDAMLRMDPTCSYLTSSHLLLSRICLLAKAYTLALPVIEQTICGFSTNVSQFRHENWQNGLEREIATNSHISADRSKLTHADHLQYFLYSGMIYMALKEWKKARHFLSIVISSPAVNSVSLIMVEAYKKWVLVNLLERGVIAPFPKVTAPVAAKTYKVLARPYDVLASAFLLRDWDKLRAEAELGQSVWRMDKNTGLVRQVLLAFRKQSVIRLSSTFAAVTTADVSRRALSDSMDLNSAERYIMSLAIQRQPFASLVHLPGESKSSMLRFQTSRNKQSTELEAYLDEQLLLQQRKLELLMHNIQASDRRLELGKEYVDHLRRAQKHSDSMSKDGIHNGKTKGQDVDLDEDMMSDML